MKETLTKLIRDPSSKKNNISQLVKNTSKFIHEFERKILPALPH
jgi:hypothetical protein